MKHFGAMLLLLLLCAAPLRAADLQERFEAIGVMSATVGEDTYEMVIVHDTENDSSFAERKIIMGSYLTINVVGMVVNEAGEPGSPMLQITLQDQRGKMGLISTEIFDDQGFDAPLVMGADGGEGSLTAYSLDGDAMQATVEGEFLRLSGYMNEPQVAEGAKPIPATITLNVTLPPLDD